MTQKDKIFKTFLEHEILVSKYELTPRDLNINLSEALKSEVPIIRTIAMLVTGIEKRPKEAPNTLRNSITQYLNGAL